MPTNTISAPHNRAGDSQNESHRNRLLIAASRIAISFVAFAGTMNVAQAQNTTVSMLTLGDAARIAAERGAATSIARARSGQVDARVAQRRSVLLPSLSTTTQISARTMNTSSLGSVVPISSAGQPLFNPRGEVLGPIRDADARTQLTLNVFDAPNYLKWRAAGIDAEAAHYGIDAAADHAAERGANTYIRVARADARIDARELDSLLAAELLDIAQQQLTAGVGIALDVTRAEAQLAESRARLISTRSERDRALLSLRQELAMPLDAPIALSGALEDPPADTPLLDEVRMIREALSRRADYQEAMANHAGSATMVRAARAELFPTVSVFADQGLNGRKIDQQKGTYSYGVQVSMSVFDGMGRSSRVREQRSKQIETDARLADNKRQIETEVRSAIITLMSTREELAATRARLKLAEQEVAQARERFRSGVSGNSDVINASIALNGARDLVIDALTNYHLARVALASAQGDMTSLR